MIVHVWAYTYSYDTREFKYMFRPVEGVPVVIDGYEDYEFAFTQSLDNLDNIVVTELNTGYRLGDGGPTQELAMESAKKALGKVTREKFVWIVNNTIRQNGSPPELDNCQS